MTREAFRFSQDPTVPALMIHLLAKAGLAPQVILVNLSLLQLLKVRTPKQVSAIFMHSCSIDLKIELLIDQDHSYRNPSCFCHPTSFSVPLAHILSVGDLFGYIFG